MLYRRPQTHAMLNVDNFVEGKIPFHIFVIVMDDSLGGAGGEPSSGTVRRQSPANAVLPAINILFTTTYPTAVMNPLHALLEQGQSIWYDFISRDFISSGEMKRLVDQGLRGMTSNPTIFEKAIAGGNAYDEQIREIGAGPSIAEIATRIFITDIRNACDVMRTVYDNSNGTDGFISIEVNPKLAAKTEETIAEARSLWKEVGRPNVMIKIPATPEGIPAVRQCISEGINVNITLMFSLEQYRAVAGAYLNGLEDRVANGGEINGINSVASVFVSRIDTMIDEMLGAIGTPDALALRGKAGLANSKLVYEEFKRTFSGERWEKLAERGAHPQRPLWASTSSKNPNYPDLLYVDNLIGPMTVNTVPPETLAAIMDHAVVRATIEEGVDEAREAMRKLADVGIDIDAVMKKLIAEGVSKFEKSFDTLFQKLEEKHGALVAAE
ncbi:MAG: Transaldolase [Chlorobi bacterium]|nr:Transaldolase [Chlorobiota bacterium]